LGDDDVEVDRNRPPSRLDCNESAQLMSLVVHPKNIT